MTNDPNNPNLDPMGFFGDVRRHPPYQGDPEFLLKLLEDKEFIESLDDNKYKAYAHLLNKPVRLSNFTENDIKFAMRAYDDLKLMDLMQKPPKFYQWSDQLTFAKLRFYLFSNLRRAIDGNERKLIATSIQETFMTHDISSRSAPQSQGVWGSFQRTMRRG